MNRTPKVNEEFRRSDYMINNKLMPSFTHDNLCGNAKPLLLSLPTKLGGMGIPAFYKITEIEFQNSSLLTEEHVSLTARQKSTCRIKKETINKIKKKIKRERQECDQPKLVNRRSRLIGQEYRLNNINTVKGASTRLTLLPIKDEEYMLIKRVLWEPVIIRYGRSLSQTPRTCTCRSSYHTSLHTSQQTKKHYHQPNKRGMSRLSQ